MTTLWVSRLLNRGLGRTILHVFGDGGAAQATSFCGRVDLIDCEHLLGEPFPASSYGSKVDHCISCERTVRRRTRFA